MSPTTMSTRLRKLGIEPRAARNTALLQLGAELPSLVLADLLGVHINTAERWNAAAGARWTAYAAMRTASSGRLDSPTAMKAPAERQPHYVMGPGAGDTYGV